MTPSVHRRGLLQCGAAAIASPYLILPVRAEEPAWPTQTVGPFVEVEIASGKLRGGHSRGALAFKAIPYAGSVSGKNRFKAPPPVTPWTGVRDATRLGPPALQGVGTTFGEHEPAQAEDCLVLNVWTPAVKDGGKRPVMVFLHGGGFSSGSGGQNIQDGAHLAARYDVVVVAINHRLALLGYLYLGELGGAEYASSGNQGQLDIVAALGWVKQNIATFGGNPSNVMVFGQSGGGAKTTAILAMPAAKGLFHKAAIQSGAMLRGMSKDVATETARRVLAGLGLGTQDIGKLAEVPADKLIALQLAGDKGPLGIASKGWQPHGKERPGSFAPVVDGTVLPANPYDPVATAISAEIPLLIGNTRDEATFGLRDNPNLLPPDEAGLLALGRPFLGDAMASVIALYRRTRPQATLGEREIAIMTAVQFGNDTVTLADRKSQQAAPVYRYRYDYQSNAPIKGTDWTFRAGHATDISVVFNNQEILDLQGNGPGLNEAALAMSSYFATFARSGVPTAPGQPTWPRYDTAKRATMLLNTQCTVVNDPDSEERQFWQGMGM